jgi:hypothetical protein
MKNLVLVSAFAVLAALFLAGCGEKSSSSSAEDPGSGPAPVHRDPPEGGEGVLKGWGEARILLGR